MVICVETWMGKSGKPADSVLDLVRGSGLPVACVGVEFGWMWSDGAERTRARKVYVPQVDLFEVIQHCDADGDVLTHRDTGTGCGSVERNRSTA